MELEKNTSQLLKRLSIFALAFYFTGNSLVIFAQVDNNFWFVVPELSHRGNTGGTPGTMRIATMELPATVTISMPANAYNALLNPSGFKDIVIDIPGNSTAAVDLSYLIDVAANPLNDHLENKPLTPDGINNFGLHITSTNMITAYWEVNYDFGADLWTLKGTNGMGTQFYTPFQTAYNNRNLAPRTYSAIDVVATEDNTQVTFTLPAGKAASYGSLLTPVPPGGTVTVNLNKGQTFSLFPLNYSVAAADHLAGTRIDATAPVSVSVKDDAIASGSQGQDVVGDQLVPVNIIGDNYIVPEINNPNQVYVLATEDNTNIYVYDALGLPIGAVPYSTLNRGQQAMVVVPGGSKYARITSRMNPSDPPKPFYTFQMGLENQSRGGAIIPAIGCTGNTQVAFTRARADNKFYFFILVEKGNEDKFLVDGVRNDGIIDPGAFTEIQGSGGWMALFSTSINSNTFSVGQHLVKNTGGIFHLGILNGFPGAAQGRLYYGYYSDFGGLKVGANVAGTNSSVVRACYGDPVQLYAYGGTNYRWIPDDYLDDATSNRPSAINLPPGPHNYEVEVSGACASGTVDLTVLVSSPVKAFFETNVSSGCSPLEINIDDQSSGVYSWQYDLGDGGPLIRYDLDPATTDIPPPPSIPFSIHKIYTNTGNAPINYEVTLLVKNESGCSDILTKTIVVNPEIKSGFTVAGNADRGCQPLDIQFQNTSTGNTGTWVWEFGDGGSSIEENPEHIFYNLFGPDSLKFNTRLISVSPFYCRDTSYHTITVMPYIEAKFAFDRTRACTPHEVLITDQSYGADIYTWDFGDGSTSASPGPTLTKIFQNTTPDSITRTIHLRVDNEEGCYDEDDRQVTIYPEVISSFTASTATGCSPLEVAFQNNSNGADSYFWNFGDGGTSTATNPVHIYDRNLADHDTVYRVSLLAVSDEICTDTSFFDITVHPYLEALFTIENITGCHPFTVTVNNQSTGADHYAWSFGDGSPVISTSAPSFDHTYLNTSDSTRVFTLRLIVSNDQGCSDTLSRLITIHPELSANFTADHFTGCHPMTVNFTDLSMHAELWAWDFGDGTSSPTPSPIHVFNNFGNNDTTYLVTLTTSTFDGECIKFVSWPITVHPDVEAEFSFPAAYGCNPFEAGFSNLSNGGLNYTWDFGDGSVVTTPDTASISHVFVNTDFVNIKNFQVSLLAENAAGCKSQVIKTIHVYPDIISGFTPSETEGCHPLSVGFTNQSSGGDSYIWDFGDGSSSYQTNSSHLFGNSGTIDSIYTVKLVSISPNHICRDTSSTTIRIHPLVEADFKIPDNSGCNPFELYLENTSVNGSIFRWDFGDGRDTVTNTTGSLTHVLNNSDFVNAATFQVRLEAESSAGCKSQVTRSVNVEPAIEAVCSADQYEGCQPLNVSFTNLSSGAAYYRWDFGDGTSSQAENPVKSFTNNGTADIDYKVWLHAFASNHECRDSFPVTIRVHPYLKAEFTSPDNIQCSPSSVVYNNTSLGGSIFHWEFGDGSDTVTHATGPVSHIYTNPGYTSNMAFPVILTVENGAGCISRFRDTVEVYPSIRAGFNVSTREGCHPLEVAFTNNQQGGLTCFWDFGDGSTSEAESPVHTFTNFTGSAVERVVKTEARSVYNCTSHFETRITIHPKPEARMETDEVIRCTPFDVTARNTSLRADRYTWDFGDGSGSLATTADPVHHVYTNMTGEIAGFDLKLIAATDFGCTDTSKGKIYVYPGTVADFSFDREGCSPLAASFLNESVNGSSWLWDFGDGNTMKVRDPLNYYLNLTGRDTLFHVSLTSVTKYGCTDTKEDSIFVYAQPDAEFTANPVLQSFPSATVGFTNMSNPGSWSYTWDMGDGFSTSGEDPEPHAYSAWGNYMVKLNVVSPHCSDSVLHTVRILPASPQAAFDAPPPECEPYTVRFTNSSVYGKSYVWDFDDGTTSSEFEPVHTFENYGYYNIKLTVNGEGGSDYAYQQLEVYRLPVVNFRIAPELVMLPDQEMKCYNMSQYGETWLWDFHDGTTSAEKNPFHLYSRIGQYDISLDVWTEHGCTARLEKPNAVWVKGEGLIIFPNAFRPDKTGPNGGYYNLDDREKNNIFHPYWEGVEDYILYIYNRWGELLYTSHDVNIGWDGYMNGKLIHQGVFVYKAMGTFINGEPFTRVGDVTLLR